VIPTGSNGLAQGIGFDYRSSVNNGRPCPRSETRPSENPVANGIDGLSFTPGSPVGVRAGLQVSF
jgi:hypothetical protein